MQSAFVHANRAGRNRTHACAQQKRRNRAGYAEDHAPRPLRSRDGGAGTGTVCAKHECRAAQNDAEQNEVDADNLAKKYLKGVEATVKPLNASLDADVAPKTQIVIVLGQDYADANPVV